jgi:hypothetical protein
MLTKFETKSARVKGSGGEKGEHGGCMSGAALSQEKRERVDLSMELGPPDKAGGRREGGRLCWWASLQSCLHVSRGFDFPAPQGIS